MLNTIVIVLQQDSSGPYITCIHSKLKGPLEVRSRKNRSRTQQSLKAIKGNLARLIPDKMDLWAEQVCQRCSNGGKVTTKAPIIAKEPFKFAV